MTAAAVGALVVAGGLGWASVAGAAAKSETLHLYAKSVINQWSTASGQVITGGVSPANPPQPGDTVFESDLDYVGTSSHHAKKWTASDHMACVVDTTTTVHCKAEIAIGGSMILATETPDGPTTSNLTVIGGTGAYAGVTGTIVAKNVGGSTNSDLTITLHRS